MAKKNIAGSNICIPYVGVNGAYCDLLVGELMESLAEEEREKKYEDAESMFAKKKLEQTQM